MTAEKGFFQVNSAKYAREYTTAHRRYLDRQPDMWKKEMETKGRIKKEEEATTSIDAKASNCGKKM